MLGMAWIEVVPDEERSDNEALESLYSRVVDKDHGRVDYIMSIILLPRALAAHDGSTDQLCGHANLRKLNESNIVVVSSKRMSY